ncbi:hypothetical protein WN51_01253 [Melipona quadrifasciata]|uniref:Uncharacterized protein n=1 Tax=Melipona quadrifasciata TaxID=166423 RepID=A0A0N0BF16_9HYME|nr:hypothetical protein WN51_01253 [Melipona quadrifasciata]
MVTILARCTLFTPRPIDSRVCKTSKSRDVHEERLPAFKRFLHAFLSPRNSVRGIAQEMKKGNYIAGCNRLVQRKQVSTKREKISLLTVRRAKHKNISHKANRVSLRLLPIQNTTMTTSAKRKLPCGLANHISQPSLHASPKEYFTQSQQSFSKAITNSKYNLYILYSLFKCIVILEVYRTQKTPFYRAFAKFYTTHELPVIGQMKFYEKVYNLHHTGHVNVKPPGDYSFEILCVGVSYSWIIMRIHLHAESYDYMRFAVDDTDMFQKSFERKWTKVVLIERVTLPLKFHSVNATNLINPYKVTKVSIFVSTAVEISEYFIHGAVCKTMPKKHSGMFLHNSREIFLKSHKACV